MRGLAVLLMVVLFAPSVGAVPWLQDGYDGARTGATPDPGPARYDVALAVDLEGLRSNDTTPLVLDGAVFVLTGRLDSSLLSVANQSFEPVASALWRIDLDTAELRPILELPGGLRADGLASDGDRLFVRVGDELIALDPDDGAEIWRAGIEIDHVAGKPSRECAPAATANGTVYVGCWISFHTGWTGSAWTVHAVDAATGTVQWTWERRFDAPQGLVSEPTAAGTVVPLVVRPAFVHVLGDLVLVQTTEPAASPVPLCWSTIELDRAYPGREAQRQVLWAIDRSTGESRWAFTEHVARVHAPLLNDGDPLRNVAPFPQALAVAVSAEHIVVKGDRLRKLDPDTGCDQGFATLDEPDDGGGAPDPALGLSDGVVFVNSFSSLYRVPVDSLIPDWRIDTPGTGQSADGLQLITTPEHVFVSTSANEVVVVDRTDGRMLALLRMPLRELVADAPSVPTRPLLAGVGEGVLAAAKWSGEVRVWGSTDASIVVDVQASQRYPAPGEPVSLDLGGTRPGAQADDLAYRVSWGDQTVDDWQDEPVFTHTYQGPGTRTASIEARNSAGQVSSTELTFDVGGAPASGGFAAAIASSFTGPNAWIAWPLLLFAIVAGVVAVGSASRARERDRLAATTTGPAPTSDTTEVYREALEHALADDGTISEKDMVMLAGLRAKLGLTERDHAIIEHAVVTGDKPLTGLVLEPGTSVLGKYEVVHLLGEGGHGLTYLARDTVLDRDVVVKILRPGALSPEQLVDEARAMARVQHPNVVSVFDVDRVGANVFVVMEYLGAGPLDDRLAAGGLAQDAFLGLATDLLGALGAVHKADQVHRDIKPANILFDHEGRAKLADFGIVQTPGLEATMAAFHTVEQAIGTIPYMSPEQAKGRSVTAASDLYSAALVLYEAWTGERYFVQGADESVVEMQLRLTMAAGFEGPIDGPPGLDAWFERALAPAPSDRFASAAAMLEALEEVLET